MHGGRGANLAGLFKAEQKLEVVLSGNGLALDEIAQVEERGQVRALGLRTERVLAWASAHYTGGAVDEVL